jgi:probable phosphoglycerate mutase
MTHLYLIRHARSTWNAARRMQGQADLPLDELGQRQAQALSQRFAEIEIDVIYSSPLVRAAATAEAIAQAKRLTVKFDDRLMERHMGDWTGLTGDEANQQYPDLWPTNNWRLNGPPNGETYAALTSRAQAAFAAILADEAGKRVAVVSHGGLLNAYLLGLFGLSPQSPIHFHAENTAITHVIFEQDAVHIMSFGDDRHLAGLKEIA